MFGHQLDLLSISRVGESMLDVMRFYKITVRHFSAALRQVHGSTEATVTEFEDVAHYTGAERGHLRYHYYCFGIFKLHLLFVIDSFNCLVVY